MIQDIQKRIDRGIKWLDKTFGRKKWLKKIDLEELDLEKGDTCVIGEVLGGYIELKESYGVGDRKAQAMGFYESDIYSYPMLTKMWFANLLKLGAK